MAIAVRPAHPPPADGPRPAGAMFKYWASFMDHVEEQFLQVNMSFKELQKTLEEEQGMLRKTNTALAMNGSFNSKACAKVRRQGWGSRPQRIFAK